MTAVVVLGGNVDAFVAAHYLRNAGHEVTLLREMGTSAGQPEMGWVPPRVVADLALERHGFRFEERRIWARAAIGDGDMLDLAMDMDASAQAIRRLSPRDADRWPEFCSRMNAVAKLLGTIYCAPPPDPLSKDATALFDLGALALRTRRLGRTAIEDLLRVIPMSIADLLAEWFESDVLKAVLATTGVMNLCQGPRSGGTAFSFLHHHVGSGPGVFRPPRSNALSVLAEMPGMRIHEAAATAIVERNDRVAGVALVSGEEIAADVVISAVDVRHTLLALCDPGWFDPALVRGVANMRSRGVAARVSLEQADDPGIATATIAPSMDYLEHAYDDLKYGRSSKEPWIEISGGAMQDGRWSAQTHVQYAPSREGVRNSAYEAIAENVRAVLASRVPALRDVAVTRVETPSDLERQYGFPQGQPYFAELALDQMLWMRPLPELAQYRTPLHGLYLCGPAMHPGGPVAGAAGANAASVILRDLKTKNKA